MILSPGMHLFSQSCLFNCAGNRSTCFFSSLVLLVAHVETGSMNLESPGENDPNAGYATFILSASCELARFFLLVYFSLGQFLTNGQMYPRKKIERPIVSYPERSLGNDKVRDACPRSIGFSSITWHYWWCFWRKNTNLYRTVYVSEQWQRQIFVHPSYHQTRDTDCLVIHIFIFISLFSVELTFMSWRKFYKTRARQIFYCAFCIEMLIFVSKIFEIKSLLFWISFNHFYFQNFYFPFPLIIILNDIFKERKIFIRIEFIIKFYPAICIKKNFSFGKLKLIQLLRRLNNE